MGYNLINWENSPSKQTPINAENLNQMDENIAKAIQGTRFNFSATFTSDGVLKNTTSTEALGAGSFATNQTDIVTVFVADNVTKINNGTFANCTSLKTIYIDNTVGNIDIVSGAVPSGVSIVYSNAEKFINVNELLASAIKSLKSSGNTNRIDWEKRATSIEVQHKTDVQALNANISQVADNLQIVKETAQREIATTNTNVNGKESLSNKVDVITHPSTNTYPSVKGVWDFVETKSEQPRADIAQNKADIVVLKVDKVDNTDFNAYKTSNDTAVKQNVTDIVQLKADVLQNAIKATTDKSTSIVLNDSSDCNIVNLICDEKDDSKQIAFYRKNLFDFSVCNINTNDSTTINNVDRENCTINFTTSEKGTNSGIYLRHVDLSAFNKGYGIDYTKLSGKPVTLSFNVQSDINCRITVQFIKASYKYFDITSEKQRIVVTDTVDINKLNKAICFYTNKTKANITISNIQIEVNNTATDYEDCDCQKVTLTDADVNSLHTYYPSTTVVSDCDSQLTYIADTKNYIDNKFNELATAIVAHESEVM